MNICRHSSLNRKARYTLIEIIVTLAIIAILAGISLGVTSYIGNKNKETQTKAALQLIRMALENYKQEFGTYPDAKSDFSNQDEKKPYFRIHTQEDDIGIPTDDDNLKVKANLWACFKDVQLGNKKRSNGEEDPNITEPVGIRGLKLHHLPEEKYFYVQDGWGRNIIYLYPGVFNQSGYDLGSVGPDGKFGDNGNIDDPGSRSSGNYKTHFGTVDDITNFTR